MSFSLTAVRRLLLPGVAAATLAFGPAARAEIHIGVVLSLTGPGASLGIPEENALKLWTGDLAGEKVRFTVLNDASDSTNFVVHQNELVAGDFPHGIAEDAEGRVIVVGEEHTGRHDRQHHRREYKNEQVLAQRELF